MATRAGANDAILCGSRFEGNQSDAESMLESEAEDKAAVDCAADDDDDDKATLFLLSTTTTARESSAHSDAVWLRKRSVASGARCGRNGVGVVTALSCIDNDEEEVEEEEEDDDEVKDDDEDEEVEDEDAEASAPKPRPSTIARMCDSSASSVQCARSISEGDKEENENDDVSDVE